VRKTPGQSRGAEAIVTTTNLNPHRSTTLAWACRIPIRYDSVITSQEPDMNRYSIDEFVNRTAQQDRGEGFFELESERMLEVNLDGMVWTKMGAMVSYVGNMKFEREGILEHGLGKLLKKSITGEGARLTKATGRGQLYLADGGKKITILNLQGETLFVNGNDLLAFEDCIQWDIKMMKKVSAVLAGGLFNVKLQGTGMIAITTHYDPMTLLVAPGRPVVTDPNATVAWSGTLEPQFKTDISLKTFFGRGSGESFQMLFEGEGFVVIQPFEEVAMQAGGRA
jgi:uncharacterized protein (AIM24 family)